MKFKCSEKSCDAAFEGEVTDLASKGWFLPRGASHNWATCAGHSPSWVPEWREKKAREQEVKRRAQFDRAVDEQGQVVLRSPVRWELRLSWPTAWSEDLYFDAKDKAYELGGGVIKGGIMTGSPLYNSPSDLFAVFPDEDSALIFFDWVKTYLARRAHDACDTRHWHGKLRKVEDYDLDFALDVKTR